MLDSDWDDGSVSFLSVILPVCKVVVMQGQSDSHSICCILMGQHIFAEEVTSTQTALVMISI
jgi:hypothetical protein